MSYTPGPWTVEHDVAEEFWFGRDFWTVGPHVDPYGDDRVAVTGSSESDARLVAAAPDLLAILIRLVDEDDCRYDHHGYCQTHNLGEQPCPHEQAKPLLPMLGGEQ